jgi:predicted Holliday junction resolvase-like endonuclease
MSLETSAAIIAVSMACMTPVVMAVLVAMFLLVRQIAAVMTTVQAQTPPLFDTVRHTADTVREISNAARTQVRRLERLSHRIARTGAIYSALSHGVAVAMAALAKRKEAQS